jgi:Bacteriophage tail sheath protein
MCAMKTPGVYIVEKNAFPSSVVEVATAVPAFIGYTEKALNGNKSLANKPWRITSMAEFHTYYGGGPFSEFTISEMTDDDPLTDPNFRTPDKHYKLQQDQGKYLLYYSMLMFYSNGGGPCYIVSIGDYKSDIDPKLMTDGVSQLVKEQEPTMVVIPETTLLDKAGSQGVQQAMLSHCGYKMKNRFAILDILDGYKVHDGSEDDPVLNFRNDIGINSLDFGCSYYPWINTSIVTDKELGFENITNKDLLQTILTSELLPDGADIPDDKKTEITAKIADIANADLSEVDKLLLNKVFVQVSPLFNAIIKEMKDYLNLLPPGSSMAGVFTMVDNTRGVWKAPANVSLNNVVSPVVNITHEDQEGLNVPLNGKSINAIRPFIGEGTLVWGARTLDGNSLDWRYINVRRTMIMLEESIKIASKAYVFEANVANTWVSVRSMIYNFLTGIWKRGGLAGASPDDAFAIQIGLGETMTPDDILEGILRVTVLVAITRPAEFIEITFQQQMQKS